MMKMVVVVVHKLYNGGNEEVGWDHLHYNHFAAISPQKCPTYVKHIQYCRFRMSSLYAFVRVWVFASGSKIFIHHFLLTTDLMTPLYRVSRISPFSYLCLRNCECPDRGMGSRASWDMWGKIRKMEEHVREITVDRGTHESWDMWGKLRLMEEHTKEVHFEPALQSLCLDASPKSFLHPRYLKLSDVSYFHSIHNEFHIFWVLTQTQVKGERKYW